MKDYRQTLIAPETTLRKAMEIMDQAAQGMVIVVDSEGRLLGVLTDGDMRRAILKGVSFEATVDDLMSRDPIVAYPYMTDGEIRRLMQEKSIREIPVVDESGKVVGLKRLEQCFTPERSNWVVLMCGGLGTRLHPLTLETPKPLLKVGDRPILETIIEQFKAYGFVQFIISLNYLSDKIKDHLGDGRKLGVIIEYIEEKKALGTAGALSLIRVSTKEPLFVMNGDVLTTVNFDSFLAYHREKDNALTIGVRNFSWTIPYGVVEMEHELVREIQEKPTYHFLINGGIYLLNAELLRRIPKNTYYDMTQLAKDVIKTGDRVGCFPITEYWMDIGRPDDLRKANQEYSNIFLQ